MKDLHMPIVTGPDGARFSGQIIAVHCVAEYTIVEYLTPADPSDTSVPPTDVRFIPYVYEHHLSGVEFPWLLDVIGVPYTELKPPSEYTWPKTEAEYTPAKVVPERA